MSWKWCSECRAFHALDRHYPIWRVWCEEYGGSIHDARKIRASTADEAAERWAEFRDVESADYSIVSGHEAVVSVALSTQYEDAMQFWDNPDDPSTQPGVGVVRFVVTGESNPVYYARSLEVE